METETILTFIAGFLCGIGVAAAILVFYQDSMLRKSWALHAQAHKLEQLAGEAYEDAEKFRQRADDLLLKAQRMMSDAKAGAAKVARGRARISQASSQQASSQARRS